MFRFLILSSLILLGSGCKTHLSLRKHTIQTASTIADMHYQQVLDNVARFTSNPSSIPSIAIVNNGAVSVMDQSTLGGAGTYAPTITAVDQIGGFPILSLFFNPNVARGVTENWTLDPVTDSGRLRRLRTAFQYVVAGECGPDDDTSLEALTEMLEIETEEQMEQTLPRDWFCSGCSKDVPKEACCIGNYHEKYVWVMPWGMEGLSRFTMTTMQLTTMDMRPMNRTVVRRYNSDDELTETEITLSDSEGPGGDDDSATPGNAPKPHASLKKLPRINKNAPLSPRLQRKRPGSSSLSQPR
ncbi:MAG: hypothetical protein WCI02_18690 [Planctomycetota bacterium]|jgi:hypothetical protein